MKMEFSIFKILGLHDILFTCSWWVIKGQTAEIDA